MQQYKRVLIFFVILSMFSGLVAQMVLGQTCRQAYHAEESITAKKALKRKACILGATTAGLGCSIAATVLSAGTLAPVTISLGVLAISIETAHTGYSSWKLYEAATIASNDLKMYRVAKDADAFLQKSGRTDRFEHFFTNFFGESGDKDRQEVIAKALSSMNETHEGLCLMHPVQGKPGKNYFYYLTAGEVVTHLKKFLEESSEP